MSSIRALRRRIRTVANTGKIAKAMKAVSVSKLRQTQQAMESWAAYIEVLDDAMARLMKSGKANDHPLLHPREVQDPVLMVVISSDRGLCGAYNARIMAEADKFIAKHPDLVLCPLGRKANRYYARRGHEPYAYTREHSGKATPELSHELTEFLLDQYQSGKCNRVVFVYNSFVNAMTYETVERQFLPVELGSLTGEDTPIEAGEEDAGAGETVIFEPDPAELASELLRRWLRGRVHGWLNDAFSAEHSARMMAMTDAYDNCQELFHSLTLKANKARQAAITKELLEVVGGAEALKGETG